MLASSWSIPDPDSADVQSAQSWRDLRMMRSRPPGRASRRTPEGDRRADVFCAALEQSEQLASAAATSSNAVKPLLAFYALSQAVRALAAAKVEEDDEWQVRGHGMGAPNATLGSSLLADVVLAPHRSGGKTSFGLLQSILGCGPWTQNVTLGAVWVALPPLAALPLPGASHPPALQARFATSGAAQDDGSDRGYVALSGLPATVLPSGTDSPKEVGEHLMRFYPSLKDTTLRIAPSTLSTQGPDVNLRIWSWASPAGAASTETFSDVYGPWAIPGVGGARDVTHPLVLWWALLFALSNRARYEPQGWFTDLDLDRNESAELIDYALRVSLGECPKLIHRALIADAREATDRQ